MTQVKNGGPAFPHLDSGCTGTRPGMSLRDYFAIRATEADIRYYQDWRFGLDEPLSEFGRSKFTRQEARYRFADAMIAAREVQS